MEEKRRTEVPETSTTLLRDVADSRHARWAVFHSRYAPLRLTINACVEMFDGVVDVLRFEDLMSGEELAREREARRHETLKHEAKTFSSHFHFPRHISTPRGK